jgi:formylglycine-generating enzyme required for sulfatase activity
VTNIINQRQFRCFFVAILSLSMAARVFISHGRRLHAITCAIFVMCSLIVSAAEPQKTRKNSLGVTFKDVDGVPVLFSDFETRLSDFQTFVRESGYNWNEKAPFPQTGDHPVVNVNVVDAVAFCEWLTKRDRTKGLISADELYRLPNNAEWDAAAGLNGKAANEVKASFPWGNQWPPPERAGNFNSRALGMKDDGFPNTAPVGSFDPAPNGLHDLAGNVWEWATDITAGREGIAALRGGAWPYFRKECLLSSYRYSVPVTLRKSTIGFRCVLEDTRRESAQLASAGKEVRDKLSGAGAAAVSDDKMAEMKNKLLHSGTLSEEEKRNAEELRKLQQTGRTAPPPVGAEMAATPKAPEAGGSQLYTNSLGMKFLPLGSGPTMMGEHEVRLKDVENWLVAVGKEREHKPSFAQAADHPAVNITWQEATAFCVWLTSHEKTANTTAPAGVYRLPTDLEWSAAAGLKNEKGATPEARHLADKTLFPWGTTWPPPPLSANLDASHIEPYSDNYQYTAPVRSFKPNDLGFHDLGGNVSEWCEDAWPGLPGERVIRGGSWLSSQMGDLLTSARQHLAEGKYKADLGFRVVFVRPPS